MGLHFIIAKCEFSFVWFSKTWDPGIFPEISFPVNSIQYLDLDSSYMVLIPILVSVYANSILVTWVSFKLSSSWIVFISHPVWTLVKTLIWTAWDRLWISNLVVMANERIISLWVSLPQRNIYWKLMIKYSYLWKIHLLNSVLKYVSSSFYSEQ